MTTPPDFPLEAARELLESAGKTSPAPRKIVTSQKATLAPNGKWMAWYEGTYPTHMVGRGATEAAAINDLLEREGRQKP